MFKKMILVISALLACTVAMANVENVVRITKINSQVLNEIQKGEARDLIVEFREGDRLPVNLKAEGDLFVSIDNNSTVVEVKKDFYVKIIGSNMYMSFDGIDFKPINELLRGNVSIGAKSDQSSSESFPANVINVVFSAFLK